MTSPCAAPTPIQIAETRNASPEERSDAWASAPGASSARPRQKSAMRLACVVSGGSATEPAMHASASSTAICASARAVSSSLDAAEAAQAGASALVGPAPRVELARVGQLRDLGDGVLQFVHSGRVYRPNAQVS